MEVPSRGRSGGGCKVEEDLLAVRLSKGVENCRKWNHDHLVMILWPVGWENDTRFGFWPNIRPGT